MNEPQFIERDHGSQDAPLSKTRVRDLCRRARNGVLSRNLTTQEEVDGLDPGEDASYNAQWQYYANLWRIREREKFLEHGSQFASRKLLAALDREPLEVELLDGSTVHIHPKSEAALRWFDDAYFWLNWFNTRYQVIQKHSDDFEKLKDEGAEPLGDFTRPITGSEEIMVEINRRVALIMWAGCQEGPCLPWPYTESAPDKPDDDRWFDLSPAEVTRIEKAMYEVNVGRLMFLPKPKERGKGITPEQFFAQRAKVTGKPISELRRARDLAGEVAEVVLAGHREES